MSYIDRIPIGPPHSSLAGDSYTAMCHYRTLYFTALAQWLADKSPASDIDLEIDASTSAQRQLVELAKAGV